MEHPGTHHLPFPLHGERVGLLAILLAVGLIASLFWRAQTWHWWLLLLVPFTLTQAITRGSLNGARGNIFVPVLYLFVGLALHVLWTAGWRIARPLVGFIAAGAPVLSVNSVRQYFEWAQSPRLLEVLDPSIPVSEYPEWRAFVIEWTRTRPEFFNLEMWRDRQLRRSVDAVGSP